MTVGKSEVMQTGVLFGLVGGAAVAVDMLKNQSCYIIASEGNKVERITSDYMEEILKESPELLANYRSVDIKRKGAADVVIEYLSKLGLTSILKTVFSNYSGKFDYICLPVIKI